MKEEKDKEDRMRWSSPVEADWMHPWYYYLIRWHEIEHSSGEIIPDLIQWYEIVPREKR